MHVVIIVIVLAGFVIRLKVRLCANLQTAVVMESSKVVKCVMMEILLMTEMGVMHCVKQLLQIQ